MEQNALLEENNLTYSNERFCKYVSSAQISIVLATSLALIGSLALDSWLFGDLRGEEVHGKWMIALKLLQYIPISLASIINGIGECWLIYMVAKGMEKYGKPLNTLMLYMIIFSGLSYAFIAIKDWGSSGLATLKIIIVLDVVIQIVVGISMVVKYRDSSKIAEVEIRRFGIILIAYTILSTIVSLYDDNFCNVSTLFLDVLLYISYFKLLASDENE